MAHLSTCEVNLLSLRYLKVFNFALEKFLITFNYSTHILNQRSITTDTTHDSKGMPFLFCIFMYRIVSIKY